NAVPTAVDLLTGTELGENREEQQQFQKEYDTLLGLAGRHREAIERLNKHLFPTTQRLRRNVSFGGWQVEEWRRHRRVAHPAILRFYLEKTLPSGVLPSRVIADLIANLDDETKLSALLDALPADEFENALDRLALHEDEYPPGSAATATRVLLDRAARVRRHTAHFFDMPPIWRLWKVVKRLLGRI